MEISTAVENAREKIRKDAYPNMDDDIDDTYGGRKSRKSKKSRKSRKSKKSKKSKKSRKIKGGVPCHRMGCPFCRGRYSSRCPYMR